MPGICVEMIPNGVMVPETVSHNSANGSLRLLYIGRIHPIKGIENLLRACRILNDTRDRAWSLAVAGSGESDYVQHICELIKKLALGGQVSLLGAVGQDDKRDLFQQSDALVLPSFSENFGLVVAEALAHGVPVIAGQGTPWKQLNSMECGLWVKNDPEHLADAIKEMRGMPIQEMGLRGRAWMRKEYSWSHTSLCMQACYEGLLN
jgi:glycosyltransferase involved in cell wall biosynthesis